MTIPRPPESAGALGLVLVLLCCCASSAAHPAETTAKETRAKPALPPEPVVTHAPSDTRPGQRIEHGELILAVDEATRRLNAQHHAHKALETRRVPGPFQPPAMTKVSDFALSKSDLDVINPGPGEYVHVMEGPFIVNIPPGVPHSFQNLDDEVAEVVVIFPSNVWEYVVLDHFPFAAPEAKALAEEARLSKAPSQ